VALAELVASKLILLDTPLPVGKGQLPAHHPGGWPVNGGRPTASSFYLEALSSGGSTSLFRNSSDAKITGQRDHSSTGENEMWISSCACALHREDKTVVLSVPSHWHLE